MAYTITKDKTVFGNKRCVGLKISADAASETVATGLQHVDFLSFGQVSMTSIGIRIRPNLTAAGAASEGSIGISGCANGDEFFVTVFGR